jgi:hypothetical protein
MRTRCRIFFLPQREALRAHNLNCKKYVICKTPIRFSYVYIEYLCHIPMVVTTVPAKKKDWPKLQLGSEETFRVTATPRFVA